MREIQRSSVLTVVVDDRPAIVVCGQLDMAGLQAMREARLELTGHDPIRVDLAGVTFIDSAGLAVLLEYRAEASVALLDVPDPVVKLLKLTGVEELFERHSL